LIAVDWFLVALLAACAFLAGLFRRLSGFGGAMVMAPLLIGFFPLVYVIPIVMTIELLAGIWLAKNWKVEKEDRPRIYRLLIASTITLPFGIYIGEQIDPQHLKIIASIAVFWFSLFLLLQPHVRLTLGSTKDHLAGAGAGFLLGSCGFGGPIIALYLGASTLDYRHVRAILSLVVSGLALLGIIFAVLFNESLSWLPWLTVGFPAFMLGFVVASYIDRMGLMTESRLRRFSLYFLLINALVNGFISLLLLNDRITLPTLLN
jgi:uncharacterized membrane protein YfcA